MIERDLYIILNSNLKNCIANKHFELSKDFEILHNEYIKIYNSKKYFFLDTKIKVKRKDQLLLNLQYNNLIYTFNIHSYEDYCKHVEEFFTCFLNYELTTGRCSQDFPTLIKNIYNILNKYNT